MKPNPLILIGRLMRVCLLASLLAMAAGVRAQDINATVAPNSGGSANFVDIKNTSGGNWYFWTAPTPAAASMSRMDSSEVGEYPWPTPGSFAPDPVSIVQNRIYPNEFLRVYPNTVAVGSVIQVEFSYSPAGTHYHFNAAVTPGAQVTSLNIIDPSPSAATIVHWRVSFDRGISGVTAANFAFANAAGLTNVSITGISADAAEPSTNWTITVNSGTGNGLLGLNWAGHASESPSVPNSFVGQLYDFSSYPIITLDPVGRGINRNTTWTMTAAAVVRGAPVNYQWYSGSSQNPNAATAISGATNSSYTPPAFAGLGSYLYFCHAYTTPGYYGNSLTATIIVVDPPNIVTQPTNTLLAINQPATFTVGATGTSLQYQWFQGTPPDMSTPVASHSPVLVTAPLTASTKYWVQITNVGPTIANSVAATATVIASLTPAPGNYSSSIGAAYPSAFAVTARDDLNNLASNVPVTFTAPSGAVPSGTFPGPTSSTTNTTTGSGMAVATTCTANGVCGIYNVRANFSTLSATFSCTNLPTFNAATLTGLTNTDTTAAYGLATATGPQSPGGTFSGAGVSGGNFNPASAGRGPHVITYAVNGVQASFTITVVETPSLVVSTNADVINPFDGVTSLREALAYATTLSATQTITFAPALSGQTILITNGQLALNQNLTIDGSSLSNSIRLDGNHGSRIFSVAGGVDATLNALVLTNGYTTNGNWGGAIFNAGTLALNYCTLAGNSGDSTVYGGAIANQGPLTVLGCTFSGNSAGFSGAIDNRSTCTLQNSTFYGNVAFAGNGGAIDNSFSATLSVLQCTFSGNSASSVGGAIDNYLSQVNITNTIASGNTSQDIYNWSGSTIDAGGANIIPALGNAGTLVGVGTISATNPLLGPLASNGGRTLTMMPQPGSPAIDAGLSSLATSLAYDQRGPGYPRVVGSAVDIGALEYEALVITSASSVTFLAGLSNTFTLAATSAVPSTMTVTGTFPPGVSFTSPSTLSGTPPYGSDGAYALTVTASNGISPNATQNLIVNVVGPGVFAAHPNFNTNGLGWALNGDTVNGGPVITNNLFTLTDGASGENRSAWFDYPLYVGAFEASFTYQDIGGGGADGTAFVVQNDPRATAALGGGGGGLAYVGITSSVAVMLNLYAGAAGGPSGMLVATNGVGDGAGYSTSVYQNTAPVNLDGGNPIDVHLRYTGGVLQINLADTVSSATFQASYPINIPSFVGTNVAWVGITGSEGGVLSHQTVSNFGYVPLPVLLSNPGSGNSVILSWPASIYGYHLQSTSNLLGNVWADLAVTVTQTNGFNLATLPSTANSQFFRLVLPPL